MEGRIALESGEYVSAWAGNKSWLYGQKVMEVDGEFEMVKYVTPTLSALMSTFRQSLAPFGVGGGERSCVHTHTHTHTHTTTTTIKNTRTRNQVFTGCVLGLAVAIAVAMLAWFQLQGALKNMTQIEQWIVEKAEGRDRDSDEEPFVWPYCLGGRVANLRETLVQSLSGDGVEWNVRQGADQCVCPPSRVDHVCLASRVSRV
jgi:hypothetical protein